MWREHYTAPRMRLVILSADDLPSLEALVPTSANILRYRYRMRRYCSTARTEWGTACGDVVVPRAYRVWYRVRRYFGSACTDIVVPCEEIF